MLRKEKTFGGLGSQIGYYENTTMTPMFYLNRPLMNPPDSSISVQFVGINVNGFAISNGNIENFPSATRPISTPFYPNALLVESIPLLNLNPAEVPDTALLMDYSRFPMTGSTYLLGYVSMTDYNDYYPTITWGSNSSYHLELVSTSSYFPQGSRWVLCDFKGNDPRTIENLNLGWLYVSEWNGG